MSDGQRPSGSGPVRRDAGSGALRVLLVDDQQLLRRGLSLLLSTIEDLEISAEAADGHEALACIARDMPDVVLADARMPRMDGVELIAACAELHPGLPVLLLTTFDDDALVRGSLAAGASGFLLKDTSTDALAEAIRAVAEGGMVMDPRVTRAVMASRRDQEEPLAVLTRTERLVAEHLAQGLTNAEIAETLVLAEGTVKNHVSSLLRKLDARDRTALALLLYKALEG